jgi:hypothetical protein
MMPYNSFDNFLFSFPSVFIMIIFVIAVCGFIFIIIKGVKTWSFNNSQPVLDLWAKVSAKRTNVSSSMHYHDGINDHMSSTTYYVTFEVESGDRMEFVVSGHEYGFLVEGDTGKLTFQGSRYKGFVRE